MKQKQTTHIAHKNSSTEQNQVSLKKQFHTSINTLLLCDFIDCYCDNNYSSLIIEGSPKEEDLIAAWHEIYGEFVDADESLDNKALIKLIKEQNRLRLKILRISLMVKYLCISYDQEFIDELRKMNYKFKFDQNNRKSYSADLEKVIKSLGAIKMQLDLINAEYDSINEKMKGEVPKRIYFTQALVRMSIFYKYRLSDKDLTVLEFVQMKKEYLDYEHRQNRKPGGRAKN